MTCWASSQGEKSRCAPSSGTIGQRMLQSRHLDWGWGRGWEVLRLPRWAESELSRHLSPDPHPIPPQHTPTCTRSLNQLLPPRVKRRPVHLRPVMGRGQRQVGEPRSLTVGRSLRGGCKRWWSRRAQASQCTLLGIPGPQPWLPHPPPHFKAYHCPAGPQPPTPLIALHTGPFYLPTPSIPHPAALQQRTQHPVLVSRSLVAQPLYAGVLIPASPPSSPHDTLYLPRIVSKAQGHEALGNIYTLNQP